MKEEDIQKMLQEKKAFVVVEILENAEGPGLPRLLVVPPEILDTFSPSMRTPLIMGSRVWLFLLKEQSEKSDDILDYKLQSNENPNFPPMSEMIEHVERTLLHLRERWPLETEFVDSVLVDRDTHIWAFMPYPIYRAFHSVPQLVPANAAGLVFRTSSPVSYAPHPERDEPEDLAQILRQKGTESFSQALLEHLNLAPRSGPDEDEPPELEFPEPPTEK